MLGLFLMFLLAFIFFSLITHFYFSLLENDLRWIAASKTLVASENIVRFATFELRAIPLYHSLSLLKTPSPLPRLHFRRPGSSMVRRYYSSRALLSPKLAQRTRLGDVR